MDCPDKDSLTGAICGVVYCPPNINNSGNFSISVCTYYMIKQANSLEETTITCENTTKMCNHSCDYLLNNVASLPGSGFDNKTIGDLREPSIQTRVYIGCVPGNVTSLSSMNSIYNPPTLPSVPSEGNHLTKSIFLSLILTLILLLKLN